MGVATELFARQGFQGTTTRQIAERARVNEAIIFRHFPTKEDLYWAVIENHCRRPGHTGMADKLRHSASDRDALASIAEEMLERRSRDSTLSRLLLFTALENHRLSHRFFRNYVAEHFEALADYIREGIAAGRFRDVDPLLAARGFLGMIVYHSWTQELFGWKRYQDFDNREVSRVLTDVWLAGMLPPQQNTETKARVAKSKRNDGRRKIVSR